MFERELIDSMFLKRWSIVRTLIPQSVAEHSWLVSVYANDIAICLGFSKSLHLRLLQRALWHDAKDEIFTSDLPGPNKRGLLEAIGPGAREAWKKRLSEWSNKVFHNLTTREGGSPDDLGNEIIELALKTADWLEASTRMATEAQMGNSCAVRHVEPNMVAAIETAHKLCEAFFDTKIDALPTGDGPNAHAEKMYFLLADAISMAVRGARHGQSAGPWITREDEGRVYDAATGGK